MFGIQKKTTRHMLYVGLNDKDSKNQEVTTVEAYKTASRIVARYYDGASISENTGVYKHDDGTIVFETSLLINILVFDKKNDDIMGLIQELKTVFNQESIALQTDKITSQLV